MELENVRIVKSARKTFCLEITPSLEVVLRAPRQATKTSIKAFFDSKEKWLRAGLLKMEQKLKERPREQKLSDEEIARLKAEAKEVVCERVRYFAEIMGAKYGKVTVRHQKSRWGSCSAKGNLSFNCLLLLFPAELLDYVVVHELCHIKYMNHSERFWSEVEKYLPDYKARRALLKRCRTDM